MTADFTSKKVTLRVFENVPENAAVWILLAATAVQWVTETAGFAVWLKTHVAPGVSLFSLVPF